MCEWEKLSKSICTTVPYSTEIKLAYKQQKTMYNKHKE